MTNLTLYEEELAEVRRAIKDVLTGAQEAQYNGQRVTKADLNTLHQRERWLIGKVNRQKRGGIRVRGGTPL